MKTPATQPACSNHKPVLLGWNITKSDRDDRALLGYHSFIDEETGETFGQFQIFEHAPGKEWTGFGEEPFEHGFYWQSCFPGCLPDADSCGPFKTAREAYRDAQEG